MQVSHSPMAGRYDVPRILHCFGSMQLGGAETFAMHAYRSIDRNRFQFDFAVAAQESCYYDDEILGLGGRIIRHTAPSQAGFRGYGRELSAILRQSGPFCAIHSHLHYFSGCVLAIAAREGVPVRIAHVHSTRDARSGTLSGFAYHSLMRHLIRRFATHVFGCSRAVLAASFGEQWPADSRISVLHNGIALAPYALLRGGQAPLRRDLSLPTAGHILGHIGNFSPAKNHTFLIEAFRRYSARDPGATLILVGDGPLRPQFEKRVRALSLDSRVRFLGRRPQPEIPQLLAAFDALVMPSLHEGLPVSLIEAQAAGVPSVVSDAITDEADLGLGLLRFVPLADGYECWANAIASALRSERPSWAARCEALTSQAYDIRGTAISLTRIYQNHAGPRGVCPNAPSLSVG